MSSTPPAPAMDSDPSSSTPPPPPASSTPLPPDMAVPPAFFLGLSLGSFLLLAVILLLSLYALRGVYSGRLYPPGPWGFPFLGYLYVLGSPDKRKLFAELRGQHGDIFSFSLGYRTVVVVNGFEALKQVFLTQGASFMDRPEVFTFTHVGQGKGLVNSSGEVWKEHRKFTLNTLRELGIGKNSFADRVQDELDAFCRVLDGTDGKDVDPATALQTAIANIVCSIAFGQRFDYDDPAFLRFLHIFDENMSVSGGMALINFFPFLHALPGDMFKSHKVLKNVEHVQGNIRPWLDAAQKRLDPKNVNDFIDAYLIEMGERKRSGKTTLSYDQLLKLVGDLMVGGTETTGTTMRWMLIFLVRWPHVQRRVRQEIDTVFPDKATPSYQERRRMPYTEATILETQRFADIAPFSLTHAACEDVTVNGRVIPKGAIVIPNVHSVHFDPALWGDAEDFRPERFLDASGAVVRPDHLIPFFIGKRACPGEGLARMELFLFATALLQRYEVGPAAKGRLPVLEGIVGITFTPKPFSVRFVNRDRPPVEEGEGEEGAEGEKEKEGKGAEAGKMVNGK